MADLFPVVETLAQFADRDAAESFVQYRKKVMKKPLTDRAARMIANSLQEIVSQGGDATEALDMVQEHGWQTIKPEWYFRNKTGGTAQPRNGGGYSGRGDPHGVQMAAFAQLAIEGRKTGR